jgi:hypothetical protein
MSIASKRGRTFKLQQFLTSQLFSGRVIASLYLCPGLTNIYLALVVIFNKIFPIGICSGQGIINIPPAAIPGR